MVIGVARVVLHIPESQSLKDKRSVVKGTIAQLQRQFHISVAEVDALDQWQTSVIGLCCISNSAAHADAMLAKAVKFLESGRMEAQLFDFQTEIIHAF